MPTPALTAALDRVRKSPTPPMIRRFNEAIRADRGRLGADSVDDKIRAEALLWLRGADVPRDFKIETRLVNGAWRHVLLFGVLGYSAASPLATVEA